MISVCNNFTIYEQQYSTIYTTTNTTIQNRVSNLEPTIKDNTSTTDWIEAAHHTSTMDCMQQLITPILSWMQQNHEHNRQH
jgi:hypothetical protein